MITFKPIQDKTLSQAVSEQIVELITTRRLKPGDRLPIEAELTQQFGVSRSTLREALKSLNMAGIIESRRNSGSFVSRTYTAFARNRLNWAVMFSEHEFKHIIEVRSVLEGQTAAFAAERATPKQKETLAQLVARMETGLMDPDERTECDLAFHLTVAEASHNPLMIGLILSVRDLIREHIRLGYDEQGETYAALHRRIQEAINAGDPEAANHAMRDHLMATDEEMLAWARKLQASDRPLLSTPDGTSDQSE